MAFIVFGILQQLFIMPIIWWGVDEGAAVYEL